MADAMQVIGDFFVNIFGSRNERVVADMLATVEAVNHLEPVMQKLSDKALSGKTQEFRARLAEAFHGKLNEATRQEIDVELEKLLPEAFAVVREAARRVIRTPNPQNPQPMRHFDVQLIGGMVLHRGGISEMATGEGKTLVATLAAYLNALPGRGVHIVTVNDFLAKRDRDWMGPLYEFLGLTAGAIQNQQEYDEKRKAYGCDITFGKDSEFGFDYLRDNMRWSTEEQVQQRGLYYGIVDEVDSVLIDEARTPLIISGPSEESTDKYYVADRIARRLHKDEHFAIKEKEKSANLTEQGIAVAEKMLGVGSIYAGGNADWPHHIEQAIRAHNLWKRDVDYVVKQGEIIIVDEFTGRLMQGRRWSDGLHQAIEAKEQLKIKEEDQTLATVTYQNLFRLYKKLSGMTGTAMTEATEFDKIYKLDVIRIPTNRPMIRTEFGDVVYRTEKEKYHAIEEEVVESHSTGRPVLVGTISIEKSEHISEQLVRRGIKHEVLNAKHHEREAQIVAQAGQMGNVVIATNMAGRGTDIVLGSFPPEELLEHWKKYGMAPKDVLITQPREELEKRLTEFWAQKFVEAETLEKTPREQWPELLRKFWEKNKMRPLKLCSSVADLGGLHIIGTERHEARRIDNQLRGRAGRQGDPGSSRFFLSLQDDLMRIFASERVSSILGRIGMEEGMAIEHGMVTRSIERAQRKVEEHNFEMRKHVLEYDEVMDKQRKAIYGLRQQVLEHADLKGLILEMAEDSLQEDIHTLIPSDIAPEDRNGRPLVEWAAGHGVVLTDAQWKEAGRTALTELFRAQKKDRPSEEIIAEVVRNARDLFLNADIPFFHWNFTGFSRWARHMSLPLEAEETRQALIKRLTACIDKAAREQHGSITQEEAAELCANQALDTYISGGVTMEEWNLPGLEKWAQAADVALPVNQWQRAEEAPDAEVEELSQRTEAVRAQIIERLNRALRNRSGADLIARLAVHEFLRNLDESAAAVEAKRSSLGSVIKGLAKSLRVEVAEEDVDKEVAQEVDAIEQSLAGQLKQRLAGRTAEEIAAICADDMIGTFLALDLAEPERNLTGLAEVLFRKYNLQLDPFELSKQSPGELQEFCNARIKEAYEQREQQIGAERMRMIERLLLLQKIDVKWKDHLLAMDHLKAGIGLRGYAQVDPKVEYTREGHILFDQMRSSVRREVTDLILRLDIGSGPQEQAKAMPTSSSVWVDGKEVHPANAPQAAQATPQSEGAGIRRQQQAAIAGTERPDKPQPIKSAAPAVGRNDPCPCGSGKKFKKCHGK